MGKTGEVSRVFLPWAKCDELMGGRGSHSLIANQLFYLQIIENRIVTETAGGNADRPRLFGGRAGKLIKGRKDKKTQGPMQGFCFAMRKGAIEGSADRGISRRSD